MARCIRGRIIWKRPSSRPCRWLTPIPTTQVLEQAIDVYIEDTRQDIGPIDDPALVEREDDEDYVANLADNVAPLTELVELAAVARQQGRLPVSRRHRALAARSIRTISIALAAASTAAGWTG